MALRARLCDGERARNRPGRREAGARGLRRCALVERLRAAIARLNPSLRPKPAKTVRQAPQRGDAVARRGEPPPASLPRRRGAGRGAAATAPFSGDRSRLIDFDDPDANDWLAVNQFTVIENKANRRPDVVLFVNGLPLGVIELKNPGDENATLDGAFNQLQTYKAQIASLFRTNAALVISDGIAARIGSLTADRERFMPWRTVTGDDLRRRARRNSRCSSRAFSSSRASSIS